MSQLWQFARNVAAVMLDGAWERRAIVARLKHAIGGPDVPIYGLPTVLQARHTPPWMQRLARAAASRPREDVEALSVWLYARDELRDAHFQGQRVRRLALLKPEMRESPWRVPALATPHELAMWLGVADEELARLVDVPGLLPTTAARGCASRAAAFAWSRHRATSCVSCSAGSSTGSSRRSRRTPPHTGFVAADRSPGSRGRTSGARSSSASISRRSSRRSIARA